MDQTAKHTEEIETSTEKNTPENDAEIRGRVADNYQSFYRFLCDMHGG